MIFPSSSTLVSAAILSGFPLAVAKSGHLQEILHSKFGIANVLSRGITATDSPISSAATVAGDWYKISHANSCGEAAITENGYRMGFCAQDVDGATSEYRIYSCTEDSVTGDVVLTETKYTDSSCSTPLGPATSNTLSNVCSSGMTVSCGASNSNAVISTMPYGGLALEEYDTSASCSTSSAANVQYYFGGRGCDQGMMFGDSSFLGYSNADCTGDIVYEFSYNDIVDCEKIDDDGDDDNDAYDDEPQYDELYSKIYWGVVPTGQPTEQPAHPMDWTGTYPDSLFGGEFKVCVTLQGGIFYGQALFSQVGYMRGTIDSSTNEWTGNWYMAGVEGRRGMFSFSLASDIMTGTFTESNGAQETLTSARSSTIEPSSLECFRTDPEYLELTRSFSFSGDWWVGSVDRYVFVDSNNILTGSYDYGQNLDVPGWYYGNVRENGHVAQLQWYEEANFEGMYLFVAKNATSQYILWWGFDWIADFNYSKKNEGHWAATGFGTRIDYKKSDITDYALANTHYCYHLITTTFEEECLQRTSDVSSENEDDDTLLELVGATFTLVLIGVIASLIVCAKLVTGRKSPMASESASDSKL
jgi:hypothetical protein